jgi:hypothetical protein
MTARLPVATLAAALLLAGCAETTQTTPTADPAAPGAGPTAAADPANGLGVSQAQIIAAFGAEGLDPAAFEAQTLQDGRQVMAASYPASVERQVLWVAIFGPSAAPHTVRVDYFPVNAQGGEPEVVGQAMDGLMTTLFPDWPEAAAWPEQAGARAWQEAAAVAEGDPGSRQVPILEGQRDAVWLGALGVPPQIVSYVFTTREVCRPSVAAADFYKGYTGCR